MYRSTDLGDSWMIAGLPLGPSWCLAASSSTVMASISSAMNYGRSPSNLGVSSFASDFFQSTDNGELWIEKDPARN